MKKLIAFIPAFFFMAGIIAQGTPGATGTTGTTDKTISNLKAEFQIESASVAKFAAFAEKAKAEGYPQIATLFTATSQSEAIHAKHAQSALEKLGVDMEIMKPEFTVKSTKDNLQDAINEETAKATNTYPGYITTAK